MKLFLVRLLVFSGYGLVLYVVGVMAVGLFFPDKYKKNIKYLLGQNGHLYTRIKQADTVKNVDVLVIGSSHAYRGYDPRIFAKNGLKMFNLGSSAQSMLQTEALLKQYIERIKPSMVIYDIYPIFLGSGGVESALDVVSNDHVDVNVLSMAFKMNSIEVYNTMLYSYFRQQAGLDKNYIEPVKHGTDTYISGGFVQSFEVSTEKDRAYAKDRTYSFNDKQVAALHRIAAMLKSKNIPLVLLQAPLPVKRYSKITNNSTVDSLLSSVGTYYNFNKVISIPDSLFADESHLNQKGVDRYNAEIFKKLNFKNIAEFR